MRSGMWDKLRKMKKKDKRKRKGKTKGKILHQEGGKWQEKKYCRGEKIK